MTFSGVSLRQSYFVLNECTYQKKIVKFLYHSFFNSERKVIGRPIILISEH